ncbi:bzip transcription factor risbz3-related [Anaeramoeba flamelloides]|uniref:Bzip transcription factor risbz3-related n=1 Tax=Anaeramoeba flamelloides TaxID=1746091 RepID=A0AAV7Y6K2_9EUKA|nr:bzip transcription factor risbz3-related [Anaeramoeba flamelloides]
MANLVPETKHKYRSRSRSISKTKTKSKTKKKTHQKHKKKNKVKTNKEKKNIKNKEKENKQVNSITFSSRKRKYLDSSNLPQNNNSAITKKEQKLEKKKDKKLEKDGKGKSKEKNRADKHNFRYKFQKIENPNEKKSKLIITRIKKKSKYVLEDGNVKKYIKNRNKARNRRNARRFRQRKKNIVQDLETEAKMLKLKKINLLGNIDDVDQENLILQRQIQLLMEDLSQSSNSEEERNETGETSKITSDNNNNSLNNNASSEEIFVIKNEEKLSLENPNLTHSPELKIKSNNDPKYKIGSEDSNEYDTSALTLTSSSTNDSNNTCSELSYLLPLFDSNKFENKQSQELEKTEIPQFFFDDLIEDNNFNFEDEEQF